MTKKWIAWVDVKTLVVCCALIGATLVLPACRGTGWQRVRSATYPPDFHYITQQEIRTTMGKLAVEVTALDGIVSREDQSREDQTAPRDREEVVAILTRMRALAGDLQHASTSNHPRIDANTSRLRDDIDRALAEARISPSPNYYYAGRVVGACTYCHAQPIDGR